MKMRIYKLIGWAMAAMSLSLFVLSCEREVILETAGEDLWRLFPGGYDP